MRQQDSTLVHLLRRRASLQENESLYTFSTYQKDSVQEEYLTYGDLDRQARLLGARLQDMNVQGQRILLIYPPGLDYIKALFACLYAGAIAIPTYQPQFGRLARQDRTLSRRFQGILEDATPVLALTTEAIHSRIVQLSLPQLTALQWIATDRAYGDALAWTPPEINSDTLAILQYTSGSTSTPKGVMLSHGHLLHNLGIIQRCFEHDESSRGVIWLPPYHDMGLIGGILQPLYAGFSVRLFSPLAFFQYPIRWLEAISRDQATTSGGPDFAYDLCARKVTPDELATLDLSSWRVAFNGAEPVRADTMRRFSSTFAPAGFRAEAFKPCYGLAEATLMVSGHGPSMAPRTLSVQTEALQHGQVITLEKQDLPGSSCVVSSGKPAPEQQLLIVDPRTLTPCQADQVGEIWVAGESVASGYWGQEEQTQKTFHAFTCDHQGPFLRTGDLGFLQQDDLFVTGRLRDLIIIRGVNYYPQDIEHVAEASHPALRPGCSAAFSIEVNGAERAAFVCEIERIYRQADYESIAWSIRQAVASAYTLEIHTIALVKVGGVPKTSSGKLQRSACREHLLTGKLPVLELSILEQPLERSEAVTKESQPIITRCDLLELSPVARQMQVERYLQLAVAEKVGVADSSILPTESFTSLGIDSLQAVELAHRIQHDLACDLSLDLLLSGASLQELASCLVKLLVEGLEEKASGPLADLSQEQPLSPGQRALWFLQQLAPTNAAYNVARAACARGAVDIAHLEAAFGRLLQRHPALRTTITTRNGDLKQIVHEEMSGFFHYEDATHWQPRTLRERLAHEAHCVFPLEQGPLFHVWAFRRSEHELVLLFVGHHLILDFWSLAILVHELGILYQEIHDRIPGELPQLSLQYADYVHWQEKLLQGPQGDALWAYWQKHLGEDLPVLNFPTDRPRPAVQTYTGAFTTLGLDETLTTQLNILSQSQGVTLYTVCLAAFQVLLARYSGQEDLMLGSLTSGRTRGEFKDSVGYFVNPLVLRTNLGGNPAFIECLARTRETVLEAFAHQEFPFATLTERLQPLRDPSRSPLFQILFVWQKAPTPGGMDLTPLALNMPGFPFVSGSLQLETLEVDQYTTQFDLTLACGEVNGHLHISLQYNTDLFSEQTMSDLLANFATLLEGIVSDPGTRLADLPLLNPRLQEQLKRAYDERSVDYPRASCMHELFESRVQRQPQANALIFQDQCLSYDELNRRANRLARHLQHLGVGPETRVGICLERSVELVVGMLAILKAGGAYVPLDPTYPRERLAFISADADFHVILTLQQHSALFRTDITLVCLDSLPPSLLEANNDDNLSLPMSSANAAYVIYTSGSTGKPKGVVIEHRSVSNFFAGMDERIGCDEQDTVLALTSISFDISVLELFWALCKGARVLLLSEKALLGSPEFAQAKVQARKIDFSLFYFANEDANLRRARYRLLIEGARFADEHGFTAVWTPERHFHTFGGLYPNPSVTSAALATITEHVQLRAGSVVLPLHDPVRVAEEWSVVDNLSDGRVGLAFASGWHANDFVFFPQNYADRKNVMFRDIQTVQRLWKGEKVNVVDGSGQQIAIQIFPPPIQSRLPIWITAAGSEETFIRAGEIGANVLTHLLGQSVEEVARKIQLYRDSLERHGFERSAGQVTLMLHTFLGEDQDIVRQKIQQPFTNYLRTSVGLIENLVRTLHLPLDLASLSAQDMDDLLAFAVERYRGTSALFGTPEDCLKLVENFKAIEVDEIACLIDFGIETADVLAGLPYLDTLRLLANDAVAREQTPPADYSLIAQAARYKPTLMQCTPSALRLLSLDERVWDSLASLRCLLLGGEPLPASLVEQVQKKLPVRIENMYGPTETTVWSATFALAQDEVPDVVPIGYPIVNTQIAILDRYLHPVPPGVVGEIFIGGDGLARGYLERPELTAERFLPDPSGFASGQRLYRTGDLGRYRSDGLLEFLGRVDQQVKLRGFRIEPGEIEAALRSHPDVTEAVVNAVCGEGQEEQLVAYLVPTNQALTRQELRTFLKDTLPDYMIPSVFVMLAQLPLTANGKIDRKALSLLKETTITPQRDQVMPRNRSEQIIAAIWSQALHVEQIGIDENFFDLGGHSLLIAQIHAQLKEAFHQEIPLVKLLEYPTVGSFARYMQSLDTEQSSLQQSVERAKIQREAQLRRLQRLKS